MAGTIKIDACYKIWTTVEVALPEGKRFEDIRDWVVVRNQQIVICFTDGTTMVARCPYPDRDDHAALSVPDETAIFDYETGVLRTE